MISEGVFEIELTANIHHEEGSYWADIPTLPGCFASGNSLDELFESLQREFGSIWRRGRVRR